MTGDESVAIVIPTYQRRELAARAVESVLAQSHAATTAVVVDDGSTDGTAEFLRMRFPTRVSVLVNPRNLQRSASRNRGVRECAAEFVGFLDSDDRLLPDAVERRLALFREDPDFDGVVFGLRSGRPPRRREGGPDPLARGARPGPDDYLHDARWLHCNGLLARRSLWRERGLFDESLLSREYTELFLRLLTTVEFRGCGAVVTDVLPDASDRVRERWDAIAEHWNVVSRALEARPEVHAALGPERMAVLRRSEYGDRLRALYRMGLGRDYRETWRAARAAGLAPRDPAFRRRYFLSFLRSRARRAAADATAPHPKENSP
ncbi:MAG: glycosyltransferase family A protein [Planctomycetota bacterium]